MRLKCKYSNLESSVNKEANQPIQSGSIYLKLLATDSNIFWISLQTDVTGPAAEQVAGQRRLYLVFFCFFFFCRPPLKTTAGEASFFQVNEPSTGHSTRVVFEFHEDNVPNSRNSINSHQFNIHASVSPNSRRHHLVPNTTLRAQSVISRNLILNNSEAKTLKT